MRVSPLLFALLAVAACSDDRGASPAGKALSCAATEGGKITVTNAWVRAQSDRSGTSAAYFSLCNGTMAPITLTGLNTGLAGRAEFHETTRDDAGVVAMAPIGALTLAPGELAVFEPGGKHVMLLDLADDIDLDDAGRLILQFSDGSTIEAKAAAKSAVEAVSHQGHQ